MWSSGSTNVTVRFPLSSAGSSPCVTVVMLQAAHWHFIATYEAPRFVTIFNWPPHCTPSKARCITIHTVTPCFFLHCFNIIPFSPTSIVLSHQIFRPKFCTPFAHLPCVLHVPPLVWSLSSSVTYATESNLQLIFLFPCWIKISSLAALLEIHQISVSKWPPLLDKRQTTLKSMVAKLLISGCKWPSVMRRTNTP